MTRKKIAFFCPKLDRGGAEMHLARLLANLSPEKYELHLFVIERGGSYERLLGENVRVATTLDAPPSSATLALVKSVGPLGRALKDLQPSLFVSLMDNVNLYAYLAWRRSGRAGKFVACIQTSLDHSIAFGAVGKSRRVVRALLRYVYPQADAIVPLSHGVGRDLVRNPRIDPERVHVIHNYGIEVQEEVEYTPPADRFVIAVCGRLVPLKGFDVVIRALGELHRQGRKPYLDVVGSGPEEDKLRTLAASEGIAEYVDFKGFVTEPQRFFTSSSLFILSSYFEGFGNVIVEAMSVGCPVLATDCPYGPAEIITEPRYGVLVPIGEPEPMARAIAGLMDDPERLASIGKAGRERARDFAPEVITAQYEELLDHLLA